MKRRARPSSVATAEQYRKRIECVSANMRTTALLALVAASASQAAGLPGTWTEREFVDPNGVAVAAANMFLNRDCRPSGLTGIVTFGVQAGHAEPLRLHIVCRRDRAPHAAYVLTAVRFERGKYGPPLAAALRDGARIGPFFFGLHGARDGLVIVRAVR